MCTDWKLGGQSLCFEYKCSKSDIWQLSFLSFISHVLYLLDTDSSRTSLDIILSSQARCMLKRQQQPLCTRCFLQQGCPDWQSKSKANCLLNSRFAPLQDKVWHNVQCEGHLFMETLPTAAVSLYHVKCDSNQVRKGGNQWKDENVTRQHTRKSIEYYIVQLRGFERDRPPPHPTPLQPPHTAL